jgi:hypothetical protein
MKRHHDSQCHTARDDQRNRARTDLYDLSADFLDLEGPANGIANDAGAKQAEVARSFEEGDDSPSQSEMKSSHQRVLRER